MKNYTTGFGKGKKTIWFEKKKNFFQNGKNQGRFLFGKINYILKRCIEFHEKKTSGWVLIWKEKTKTLLRDLNNLSLGKKSLKDLQN